MWLTKGLSDLQYFAALAELPAIPEGVATLGMLDIHEGLDENYLIVSPSRSGRGLPIDGYVRRPLPWIARHLKYNGALVASGIVIGYAAAFAAHISRMWPGISNQLALLANAAEIAGEECDVPSALTHQVPKSVLKTLRWQPPFFKQRAVAATRCGWSGLNSAQSVTHVLSFLRRELTMQEAGASFSSNTPSCPFA